MIQVLSGQKAPLRNADYGSTWIRKHIPLQRTNPRCGTGTKTELPVSRHPSTNCSRWNHDGGGRVSSRFFTRYSKIASPGWVQKFDSSATWRAGITMPMIVGHCVQHCHCFRARNTWQSCLLNWFDELHRTGCALGPRHHDRVRAHRYRVLGHVLKTAASVHIR